MEVLAPIGEETETGYRLLPEVITIERLMKVGC